MAASGFTPISLYYSTTASAVPTSGNLANGELGLNIADMKLYAKNSAGTVTLLAASVTPVANGGTGITSTPTNGQIPIGNGTTYTAATLTAGTGVSITNASGAITINATGTGGTVTSVSGTGTVNGLTLTGTVTTSGSLTLGGTLSLVSPPAIGSTTPNTGAFTTLSATTSVEVNGTYPKIYLIETDAATDNRQWWFESNAGVYQARVLNDAISVATTWLSATRSGTTITQVALNASTGGIVLQQINGTTVTNVSSTGLAVTGSLSSTTGANFATSSGSVGIGNSSPAVFLDIGSNNSVVKVIALRYSSVPLYLTGGFDGLNALNTFSANSYPISNGAGTTWSGFGNAGYTAAAVQLSTSGSLGQIIFLTASAGNTAPTQRFNFGASGQFGIGATPDYGTAGQVLTSGGASAAPTWAAAGGGSQAFVAFGSTGGY